MSLFDSLKNIFAKNEHDNQNQVDTQSPNMVNQVDKVIGLDNEQSNSTVKQAGSDNDTNNQGKFLGYKDISFNNQDNNTSVADDIKDHTKVDFNKEDPSANQQTSSDDISKEQPQLKTTEQIHQENPHVGLLANYFNNHPTFKAILSDLKQGINASANAPAGQMVGGYFVPNNALLGGLSNITNVENQRKEKEQQALQNAFNNALKVGELNVKNDKNTNDRYSTDLGYQSKLDAFNAQKEQNTFDNGLKIKQFNVNENQRGVDNGFRERKTASDDKYRYYELNSRNKDNALNSEMKKQQLIKQIRDNQQAEQQQQNQQQLKDTQNQNTYDVVKDISRSANYSINAGDDYQGTSPYKWVDRVYNWLKADPKTQYYQNFKNIVDSSIFPQMRQILGAQYTENEGKKLMETLRNEKSTQVERLEALRKLTNTIYEKQGINKRINNIDELLSIDPNIDKNDNGLEGLAGR